MKIEGCLSEKWAVGIRKGVGLFILNCLVEEASIRGFETVSDMLYILYVEQRYKISIIADMFCVSDSVIRRYLKRMGVWNRNRRIFSKELVEEIEHKTSSGHFSSWKSIYNFIVSERLDQVDHDFSVYSPQKATESLKGFFCRKYKGEGNFTRKMMGKTFPIGGVNRRFSYQDRVKIYNEYLREEKTMRYLAEKYDCSEYCIYSSINKVRKSKKRLNGIEKI